jgi:hypothetical protein
MSSPRFNHGFENDVFISYCHIDDKTDPSGLQWVFEFEKDLRTLLEQNSGRTVRIWRDPKLNTADRFDTEIISQLRRSALLIAVLTRSYFSSEFCQREWREFMRVRSDVGNTSRIVKVAKTYVPLDEYPKELLGTNQHKFFVQEQSGQFRQYHLHPDPAVVRQYMAKVDDVAQELSDILRRLEGAGAASSRGVVYVAETSSDLNAERDRICRILNQLRYDVVPKAPLFGLNAPDLRKAVERDLASSAVAIIPVGAYYGLIPELGGDASILRLQIETAAADARNGNFARLVWIPKDLRPAEPRQVDFIRQIREKWSQRPFEVLEIPSDQLQEVLELRLNPRATSPRSRTEQPERPSVYVLCELEDEDAAQPLRECLFEQDFDAPGPPEHWDDPGALRTELRCHYTSDDAFLVYYGRTTESWVREKLKEISKSDGLGRAGPVLARAVFLAEPETRNKKQLLVREPTRLLHGFSGAAVEELLAPFVRDLRQAWIAERSNSARGSAR